jgi:DNA invertase Pin-like site-specific DNA recombinase
MTKPIAVYLRISDKDQSHESQRLDVDRFLAREGIDLAKVEWYIDTGTGRNLQRQEFTRLRADIKTGKRSTVVVYALDRISRDFFDGIAILGEWLKSGVRVASVTESIDLSGEIGQAIAAVIFALASAGWRQRRERQRTGIEIAKGKGVYTGAKPGYRKSKPDRAVELARIGLKWPEIAKSLGVSVRTVARYLGETRPNNQPIHV